MSMANADGLSRTVYGVRTLGDLQPVSDRRGAWRSFLFALLGSL